MNFYLGTLTRAGAEGLLVCSLEGNRLQKKFVFSDTVDPSYLLLSRDGKRLFAVTNDLQQSEMHGCVTEFEIRGDELVKIASQPTLGTEPCYLTFDPDERFLYIPNYDTATVSVLPVEGGLQPVCQQIRLTGSGPHPTRQTCAHPHQTTFIPGTRCLLVCDLGTDSLLLYDADPVTGRLTPKNSLHLFGGPRHVVYGENGSLWLAHELSNQVTVLQYENDGLIALQTVPMLPDGFDQKNTAAAIRLSADGKKLYASNRGHGSVVVYDVNGLGLLSGPEWILTGEFPRDFVLLDDGRLLVADQNKGVWLHSPTGEVLDFWEENGAVCICLTNA